MSFVLTNDDGIDAPGIQALREAVEQLHQQAVTIAPQAHLSGCGHQVTTTAPIQVDRRSPSEFAIAGTPADCTRLALKHLCPEVKWVLSGINAGGNLGADVYISGTVAAVREAALNRVAGIAISQYRHRGRAIDWNLAVTLTAKVLADLLARPLEPGSFWNVNLPHLQPNEPLPELVFCPPCTQPLPIAYRVENDTYYYAGDYGSRQRDPGADVAVCFAGQIAVTQIRVG
ncbi:MAG TPA: 5'/3'-nucleotidase SurE [Thermosynechococcaceae cyanobacterium]